MDELAATLGGRVSEQITFGHVSTGALNDLERVTKQAYAMVAYYGMSPEVGTLSYYDSTGQSDMSLTKPYSERTAQQIDTEARRIIDEAYAMAERVLHDHADGLRELAELLLEREVVFTEDVERIFGRRRKDILREQQEEAKKQKGTSVGTARRSGTDGGCGLAGCRSCRPCFPCRGRFRYRAAGRAGLCDGDGPAPRRQKPRTTAMTPTRKK